MLGSMTTTDAAPMTADVIDLLAELIDAGTDGVHLDDGRQQSAGELHGRHLARPTARPGVVTVALAWHGTEASKTASRERSSFILSERLRRRPDGLR